MRERKVISIVGQTSSGKTALSIDIAREVDGEIVSADSRQVYRGLDLGSGKATVEEMDGVPHHLIDVADPRDTFTAAEFVRLGTKALEEIMARSRIPLVVGGTGFYIDALLGRITLAEVPPNNDLRERLTSYSTEELQDELRRRDPKRLETIDQRNPRRLVRALEVAQALGTTFRATTIHRSSYDTLWIGLRVPRKELKKKINTRLHARLAAGMLEEAKRLRAEGLSFERMEALGLEYRSMARHLQGKISYDEMVAELEKDIARYAKRQMTWFKKNTDIRWFGTDDRELIVRAAKAFVRVL